MLMKSCPTVNGIYEKNNKCYVMVCPDGTYEQNGLCVLSNGKILFQFMNNNLYMFVLLQF